MLALKILGGAILEEDGQPVSGAAVRRHPLALLAIVATAQSRAISREKLINLLWPTVPEDVGRNRLTSTLYLLRRQLGPDGLVSSGDGLRLDRDKIRCDVWEFRHAAEADQPEMAAEIYAGPFLDGFYLEESIAFEEWARTERQKLHTLWRDKLFELASAADAAAAHTDAVRWWQQLAADDPLNSAVTQKLAHALAAAGNKKEAIDAAEAHAARLHKEIGSDAAEAFWQSVADLDAAAGATSPTSNRSRRDGNGIAILPFEALAGTQDRILAEGVHSGVLARLSAVDGLDVIANTSLRRFLNTRSEVPDIASGLGVNWVLEGDVQTVGDRFRVSVRLIDAAANRQVRGHEYIADLEAADFFDVLAKIAGAIVDELEVELSEQAARSLAQRPTESLDAYRLCMRARLHLDQRSPEDMQKALRYFEEAVVVDPEYALAWVGVADSIGLLHAYGYGEADGLPRAEAAIEKAMALGPDVAEAHAAYGRLMGQYNRNREAMQALQRAVTLKPAFAEAFNWMTIGYHIGGRPADALKSSRRAVMLNPLSSEALNNLCSSQIFNGQFEDAIRTAEDAEDLDDEYDTTRFFGAIARYEAGKINAALNTLESLVVPWAGSGVHSVTAVCLAESNQTATARKLLKKIREAGHGFDEGLVLAALGDFEAAEAVFETAVFDGLDFSTTYWPTVAVRYLFRRVWSAMPDDRCYSVLLSKADAVWRT